MSEIEVYQVKTKNDLKDFIYLAEKIHKNHKNWVPPLYMDEFEYFDFDKSSNFKKNEHILFLAKLNGELVGRIMGIIPKQYNKFHSENNARFSHLESVDNIDVSRALLDAVSGWAANFGVDNLVGPLAFSDKEPQGFLYEGFDNPHVMASNCNFEYQTEHLQQLGFDGLKNLFVYNFSLKKELPEVYHRLAQRNLNRNYRLVEFSTRITARKYIRPILHLVNHTYKNIYASVPFTESEMDDFANKYLMVIHPNLIKVVLDQNNEPVAFVVAMRDIGKGLKIAKGRLFPFGFIPFLYHQTKSKQLNLLLGAVHPDHRNKGLDALLGVSLFASARKLGLEYVDSHLILEENIMMRKEVERIEGEIYKKYRIFTRPIKKA